MAGTYKRAGAASWGAIWKDERGHNLRKSTFVNISQPGKKEAQTRREAQAVADAYEAVYKGRILYTKQAELFRATAGPSFDEQRVLITPAMNDCRQHTPPSDVGITWPPLSDKSCW